jgi:hypothetical protein
MFKEEEFGKELDAKYEQWLAQPITEAEDPDVRERLCILDTVSKTYKYRCGYCNLPIEDTNFRVLGHGEVCKLCYDMYHAVHDRMKFIEAHRKWKEAIDAEEKKRKEKEEDDPYGY